MPIKRIKDRTHLIKQWTLKSSGLPYYYHAYLWKTKAAFDKNTIDQRKDKSNEVVARFCPTGYFLYVDSGAITPESYKLGELHFIKDKWDGEIVAHEMLHAFLHHLRVFPIARYKAIGQEEDIEEFLCARFGSFINDLYRALWKANPSRKWKRAK